MKEAVYFKTILAASSVLTIFLLATAVVQENIAVEWKQYQKSYRASLLSLAKTGPERSAADIEIKLRQDYLPQLGRTDRCITCHLGVDNPKMSEAPVPLKSHSGNILERHPGSKFGCSVCHDGQGLATSTADAHGEVPHWPTPLLRGELVYTSCSRCHYENDLYGAEMDLFSVNQKDAPPILKDELTSHVPGAETVARGKNLVLSLGCLGCHKYRGHGGSLGPEITSVGDKSSHDFDFTHVQGEHSVRQWLFEHFISPERLSPGTLMPALKITDLQVEYLTQYMLSLHRKNMPATHTPIPPRQSGAPAGGRQLYGMFCSACHGRYGQGSTVRDPLLADAADVPPDLMVPSLNNPDTLSMASDGYLDHIISYGRPDTTMPAWKGANGGGLRPEEIARLVETIRNWDSPRPDEFAVTAPRGDPRVGSILYGRNCAACHGPDGLGGIGTSLSSPGFLAIANDEFLAQTLIEGRPDTAMPSWKQFDSQQLSDLIAFMTSWHPLQSSPKQTLSSASSIGRHGGVSTKIGRILYDANCVMCHGELGEGDLAPSISTQEFLTVADNRYLYETLAHGRPGTGMPAWRQFSDADLSSLIGYIRQWQSERSRVLSALPIRGDWDMGELLYKRMCVGCHGTDAEGGVGPQLNNPVFLSTTTDAMLFEWIANGKAGTQMRAFTKGAQGMAEISYSKIIDVVSYIRSLERLPRVSIMRSPNGRPELGRLWFAAVCASCHGEQGEGASGPSITNGGFLKAASDGYLMATLALGRDGTEMRPMKKSPQSIVDLSSDQVNDLVAYLRSWELNRPDGILHNYVIPWDLSRGKRLYISNCSGCHGINGRSEIKEPGLSAWAPALNNEGFLSAATDGFLQATIVRGRRRTAMAPFGRGMQGMVDLTPYEIDDIVAFIRRWSSRNVSPMTIPAESTLTSEADN